MSRTDRAKQFMPFSALRGFEYILQEQKLQKEEKKFLSEDDAKILNDKIINVKKGQMLSVVYYLKDRYVTIKGVVSAIDFVYKTLSIVKTKISFDDILELYWKKNKNII